MFYDIKEKAANEYKIILALKKGSIKAIGSIVYDSDMNPIMNSTDLFFTIKSLKLPINRIDSGGSPEWILEL
jgi:hypothetical protein